MEDARKILSGSSRQGSMVSRASVREFDDKHLMQQVKQADVHHSETPSDFEHWQPGPITGVHLKQAEDKQQQGGQQSSGGGDNSQGDWNHNQPKGKSAEAIMLYLGGARSHPVALVDDRRVRPYAMNPGESAMYALSGTGQMLFHNDDGSHLVATNNPPEQSTDNKDKERYASLRHVKKKKQSREIKKDQKIDDPKHAGETINGEVRCTSTRIEFRFGDTVVGYYDSTNKKWYFEGTTAAIKANVLLGDDDQANMKEVHRRDDVDDAGNKPATFAKKVWAK